ncbi:MAG TPA: hypothetical protein VF748_14895 [Candidatus Acidoferrum sp.]
MTPQEEALELRRRVQEAAPALMNWLTSQEFAPSDGAALCVAVAGQIARNYYDADFVEHLKRGLDVFYKFDI